MQQRHEVHKSVTDLLAGEELEQAFQLCADYMESLDDSFLRFNYLCLATRLGQVQVALDWLEDSLNTEHWFSVWFLRRSPDLHALHDFPEFQKCLQVLADKEADYWRQGRMKPLTLVPPNSSPPYPLLVGLHGNGYNTLDASHQWACAPAQGWLATFPLAPHLDACGEHWWDSDDESIDVVLAHLKSVQQQFSITPDRLLWSGFSRGGEVAMQLALRGCFDQKVFLTIGAGGTFHTDPERWRPVIEAAAPDARGVMMYSPYDRERVGKPLDLLVSMLADRGIACQIVDYEAEGHVFPHDFETRFRAAVEFLFSGSRSM